MEDFIWGSLIGFAAGAVICIMLGSMIGKQEALTNLCADSLACNGIANVKDATVDGCNCQNGEFIKFTFDELE